MIVDPTFEFPLSVSHQRFESKPSKDGQISKIVFVPCPQTIDSVLRNALEGHAFCYDFFPDQDGRITMKSKTIPNFRSTSTLFFDFDKMIVPMCVFIETLPNKPTFAYTTYNDGKNGYYCFRLVYVVEKPITSKDEFGIQYRNIAQANGFIKAAKGKCGGLDELSVAQFYYGTSPTASVYRSGIIYSQDDFSQFISTPTGMKIPEYDRTEIQVDSCREVVTSTRQDVPVFYRTRTDSSKYEIDTHFLRDFRRLSPKEFFTKYRSKYYQNYLSSLSTPLLMDESKMFSRFPDDYVCIFYKRRGKNMLKWRIGEDRKKKLYVTAQIMLYNIPSLTIENLIYNLAYERYYHYDNSDNKICDDVIIQTAINAFLKCFPLSPSKHGAFKLNKPYWVEIGKSLNQAKMMVRGHLKVRDVKSFWNPNLTIKDNHNILTSNGVKISKRGLQRMVKRGDIKIIPLQGECTYLSCCRDSVTIRIMELIGMNEKITQPEIAEDLNVDPRTVKRYMSAMKGVYIEREGNNRTGRWIVLQSMGNVAGQDTLSNQMTLQQEESYPGTEQIVAETKSSPKHCTFQPRLYHRYEGRVAISDGRNGRNNSRRKNKPFTYT